MVLFMHTNFERWAEAVIICKVISYHYTRIFLKFR